MRYTWNKINVLTIMIYSIAFSVTAQVNYSEEKSKEIDLYIQHVMQEQKIPGLALAIIHDGKILKKEIYGLASIEHNVPVTDSSVFWLASISKHMTCSAIMLLSQQGVLDIDDKIHLHLPDAPENWREVTIRHLMTHTSGLPGTGSERGNRTVRGTYSAEQMFQNSKNDSLVFTPGQDFMYSDLGIFLLGYIIHKVCGMSFKEFMQKMIFDPAGMKTAYLQDHFTIHANQVSGYSKRNGQIIPDRNPWRLIDTEINAAGGVYATIDDMISWDAILNGERLLTQEIKEQMWTSNITDKGINTHYGFGWNTQTLNDRKVVYHPGVAGTEYLRLNDDKVSIIVLTNQAMYKRAISRKITELLEIFVEKDEEGIVTGHISEIQPDKKEIQNLTGKYEFISNSNYSLYFAEKTPIAISADKDQLWIEHSANTKYPEKFKLVKLENGRLVELSWFPFFMEISFMPVIGEDGTFMVYENYGAEYDSHVGELKRSTFEKKE